MGVMGKIARWQSLAHERASIGVYAYRQDEDVVQDTARS